MKSLDEGLELSPQGNAVENFIEVKTTPHSEAK